jgi:sterol desaturase/sphingolipid hydroxylase (fatty acid hydroxylase superfamily)
MIYYYLNLTLSFFIFGFYTMFKDYNNDNNKIKAKSRLELDKIYNKIIPNVFFNVFLLSLPAIYYFDMLLKNPDYHLLGNLPLAAKYLAMPLLVDIMFYINHRTLHTKYLFYFHKRHHELVSPVGLGSFYMSPVEFYWAIVIPIFGPLVLLGSNTINTHLWITFSVFNGICVAHSNTKNLSEFHDYHHNAKGYFKYNFGIDIFMDRLFRTRRIQ